TALENGRRLCLPRQLGVSNFVAVVAQLAGPVDPIEEVRMAAPAAVEEGALIDDVDTGLHGGHGLGVRLLQVGDRTLGKRELDDPETHGLEAGEVSALVLQATAAQHVQNRIVTLRPG